MRRPLDKNYSEVALATRAGKFCEEFDLLPTAEVLSRLTFWLCRVLPRSEPTMADSLSSWQLFREMYPLQCPV